MSLMGQKLTSTRASGPSALPPTTDILQRGRHVREVPQADIRTSSYACPLAISISTLMRRLPFDSNCNRRDRTSSRTARRSLAASRK
jgi:hypothetical protein